MPLIGAGGLTTLLTHFPREPDSLPNTLTNEAHKSFSPQAGDNSTTIVIGGSGNVVIGENPSKVSHTSDTTSYRNSLKAQQFYVTAQSIRFQTASPDGIDPFALPGESNIYVRSGAVMQCLKQVKFQNQPAFQVRVRVMDTVWSVAADGVLDRHFLDEDVDPNNIRDATEIEIRSWISGPKVFVPTP